MNPTGDDTRDCRSEVAPCRTMQRAYERARADYDFMTSANCTIKLSDGLHGEGLRMTVDSLMNGLRRTVYVADSAGASIADRAGYPLRTMPRRPLVGEPGLWYIYELPNPNIGNYSPIEVVTEPARQKW